MVKDQKQESVWCGWGDEHWIEQKMLVLELRQADKDLATGRSEGSWAVGSQGRGLSWGVAESVLLLKELPLAPRGGPAGGAETSDVDVAIVLASKDELRMQATAAGENKVTGSRGGGRGRSPGAARICPQESGRWCGPSRGGAPGPGRASHPICGLLGQSSAAVVSN